MRASRTPPASTSSLRLFVTSFSLTFRGFEALTVEALRDLRAEKDAQIDELKADNRALRARLAALEAAVAAMAAHR